MSALPPEKRAAIEEAIRGGVTNVDIGRTHDVSRKVVANIRAALGVEPCVKGKKSPRPPRPETEVELRMRTNYDRGMSDHASADLLGIPRWKIQGWRNRHGLPANGQSFGRKGGGRPKRTARPIPKPANPTFRNPLYAAASKAVSRQIAPDIRDDAISNIVLAVLSGELDESKIAKSGPGITNRTFSQWASKFTPKSLDEDRDGEEGWTLYGAIPDPRQEDDMRLAALVVFARRSGINVEAVLDSEDEPRERWNGRRMYPRRRQAGPNDGRRGPRDTTCMGPAAARLRSTAYSYDAEARRYEQRPTPANLRLASVYRQDAAAMRARAETMPRGRWIGDPGDLRWVPVVEHEYPLVGERA